MKSKIPFGSSTTGGLGSTGSVIGGVMTGSSSTVGGTVTGDEEFAFGTTITLTALANEGYSFVEVLLAISSTILLAYFFTCSIVNLLESTNIASSAFLNGLISL